MKNCFKLLFGVIFLFVFATCNKKKDGPCFYPDDKAVMFITVYDNFGDRLDNALINVFSSSLNFENARLNKNNSSFAYDSVRSSLSEKARLMVNGFQDNWILVTYYDSVQGKLLSSELTLGKLDKLEACSDYHVTIRLAPVGATVAFWTDSNINLPISITFNGNTQTLTNSTTVVPISPANPGVPNVSLFSAEPGTYQYQASSPDGCSWQGEVTLVNGQFAQIKLNVCQRAYVAFYYDLASAVPTDKQTITIFIDNQTVAAGTLTAPVTSVVPSNSCSLPPVTNVLYVPVEPGVPHTYKAISSTGGVSEACIWTGEITAPSTDCNLNAPIYLGQGCN